MANKRVGILTFHDVRNYGAALQAYALMAKVKEMYPDTEIINYQNDYIHNDLYLWRLENKSLKGLITAVFRLAFRFKKKIAFDMYIKKNIYLSSRCTSEDIESKAREYDIVIVGSDQVWNTELTDHDSRYFLDFVKDDKLKYSYAASFGDQKVILGQDEIELIKRFDMITLREDLMKDEIRCITNSAPEICCDPCLLLDLESWKKQVSNKVNKKRYIFLFLVKDSERPVAYANKLAAEKNLKIVTNKNDIKFLLHCDPCDFLAWILNAEYIVTDSFHCTVFSVLFHKQFISQTYTDDGNERSRVKGILRNLDLESRALENENLCVDSKPDWDKVDENIGRIRMQSWNFFKERLIAEGSKNEN